MPVPKQAMYSGIKHAVLGLSHSLREEAAHYGVKVSAVLPGLVKSDMWESAVNIKDYSLKKSMDNTGYKTHHCPPGCRSYPGGHQCQRQVDNLSENEQVYPVPVSIDARIGHKTGD